MGHGAFKDSGLFTLWARPTTFENHNQLAQFTWTRLQLLFDFCHAVAVTNAYHHILQSIWNLDRLGKSFRLCFFPKKNARIGKLKGKIGGK